MIGQDISEKQVRCVYLGIGSNLGNRLRNIEKAKFLLIQQKIFITKTSSYYESPSWPNPNNPKFLNIVVKVSTTLNPLELMKYCKNIEVKLGRKKNYKNAPRECDIDIIDYSGKTSKNQVIMPHPRMHQRNFVLLPLFELNREWFHPILKKQIKKLISLLPDRDIRSIKQI